MEFVIVKGPDGWLVLIDGEEYGGSKTGDSIEVEAGTHAFAIRCDDGDASAVECGRHVVKDTTMLSPMVIEPPHEQGEGEQ